MSESHRILVVDDDFATLDFLRSILELSDGDFEVLGVPSAEEGILALRRANFNLLVADVRLPGMSGLEMIRKAREFSPGIPAIMITGYDSPEAEAEAATLGVVNYFSKPLDAEDFLNAVFEAVEGIHALGIEVQAGAARTIAGLVPVEVSRRLETLLTDTGAQQVVLATLSGEILACSGGRQDEELQRLITAIAFNMDSSFTLSDRIGAAEPQAMLFLVGEECDLYCSNINREHFLAILFDAQIRRGRIGTVWVFTRRAIVDLKSSLAEHASQSEEDRVEMPLDTASENKNDGEMFARDARAAEESDGLIPPHSEEDVLVKSQALEPGSIQSSEIEEFDAASTEPWLAEEAEPADRVEPSKQANQSSEEFQTDDDTEPVSEKEKVSLPEDLDLQSFWEDILQEEGNQNESEGITFEEALKRGIISPDFNPEDD